MPKYIRTKDRVYGYIPNVVSSIDYDKDVGAYSIYYFNEDKGEHLEQDGKGGHSMDSIWDEDIITQADDIKDLCDAFIIEEDNKRTVYLKEDNWTFDMIQDLGTWSGRTCYGSIWVKGTHGEPILKPVTKMNSEGVLKLI